MRLTYEEPNLLTTLEASDIGRCTEQFIRPKCGHVALSGQVIPEGGCQLDHGARQVLFCAVTVSLIAARPEFHLASYFDLKKSRRVNR
jgi:hypothetical protein